MNTELYKRDAAEQAAAMVEDGMAVGLGTGSTAYYFIAALIRRAAEGLRIVCIPTSERSAAQAREGGLTLADFSTRLTLDLAVDGADEIHRETLDLTKGLGGALLREKIVASAARRLVIIADGSKLVDHLGTRAPIPVEVTAFGWQLTAAQLQTLGAEPTLRRAADGAPYRTDGGNYILDAKFAPIADAASLQTKLKALTGVIETGIFPRMAECALVATAIGVERYLPRAGA